MSHNSGGGILRAMRDRWALVALATLLFWAASQALRPIVVLRLDELGSDTAQIGWIVAAYPVVSLLLAVPGGRLVDRVGTTRVLVASVAVMAASGAGYAVATTIRQLIAIQVLNGVAELFVWLALQTLATRAGNGDVLTRNLALFSLAWGVGAAVGPLLGTWVFATLSFEALGWIYTGLALLTLVAHLAPRHAQYEAHRPHPASNKDTLRGMATTPAVFSVLLSTFIALYLNSIKISFYPLFLAKEGIPVQRVGYLLTAMGVASVGVRILLPYLLRVIGPGRLLVFGMWVSLLPLAATPWLPNFPTLLVAAVVVGAGYGISPPVTVQLMALHTGPHERGQAMGLRVTSNRLAQVVQPIVFGALASSAGMASAFAVSGGILGSLAIWAGRAVGQLREGGRAEP